MEEDRISKLPDEILHHILSKIGIREAVETSILSKRWRTLWSSLPNLSFSYSRLAKQWGAVLAWSHYSDCFMPRFEHFVINFLSHRDHTTSICEFQLSSANDIDPKFFETCLDYAINEGVHRLDLDAHGDIIALEFPKSLFASKTLRVLKLRQYKYDGIVIPKPFVLSNLKTLYLEWFDFKDDVTDDTCGFTQEPFSSFPNLEELTLDNCDVSGLIISASELRTLEIFNNRYLSREKKIEKISTPKLTSFRYTGSISLVCPKVDFRCLEEVYVDISPILESPYTDDMKKKLPLNTVRMLQQLGNAKFVTLSLTTIEVLELDLHLLDQSLSPFPNLQCLKLKSRTKKMPPTVKNYLTKGSSFGDSVVVEGMIE